MHIALVPILLGRGESLLDGLEGLEERFAIESVSSPSGAPTSRSPAVAAHRPDRRLTRRLLTELRTGQTSRSVRRAGSGIARVPAVRAARTASILISSCAPIRSLGAPSRTDLRCLRLGRLGTA